MALTDVAKTQALVWVACPVEGFTDERHLFLPYSYDVQRNVVDLSQTKEMVNGTIQRHYDPALFDSSYIKLVWKGWEGVGIRHTDGRVEDPAEFNETNKGILLGSRPPAFFVWLQQVGQDLAKAAHTQNTDERDNFRTPDDVSAPEQEPELPGMPDAS